MEELLRSWGISDETIEVFNNHGIDISCLDGIEDEELKILIPDLKLRDRIKFKTGYKKYKEDLETVHLNTDSLDSLSCDSIDSILFSDVSNEDKKSAQKVPLQEILLDNIHGRQALQALKEKSLNAHARNNLVKGIIEYYVKKKIKLSKVDFELIANDIVQKCPNECKETYYVPSRSVGLKNYMPAKGKLIDRYYNQLRALRGSGVLPKKRKFLTDDSEVENEADEELHTWLKFNRDPWPVVEEKWQETCSYRKKKYQSECQLTDVLNDWPCLKSASGHRLIDIDFCYIHPEKDLKLFEKWNIFVEKSSKIFKERIPENDLIKYLDNKRVALNQKQLGRRLSVPVIYVRGSHYDVGFDVGRNMGSLIKNFLATYENLRDFEREYRTDVGREAYEITLLNMKRRYPFYVKEMQGVADGANVPFYQLFLLQMDDIIGTINENTVSRNDTGGCSSIGINTGDQSVLGHTEDAFSETLNHFYIMSAHIIPTAEDKELGAVEERFASLCYAGHLPGYTMGYNENGLVFSINTLSPAALKPGSTPRTFITRALLASKSFDEAESILRDEGLGIANGFSVNMLWSDAWGGRQLYNVEVAPDLAGDRSLLNIQKYEKEPLVHCNIYQRLSVKEVIGSIIDSSESRLHAIHSHPPPLSRADIQNLLSDTSGTNFQVFQQKPDSIIKTIAAGIFDLEKRTWSIYIEKPNASEPVAILPIRFSMLDKNY